MKLLIIVIIIILISVVIAFVSLYFFKTDDSNIITFEQCVEAGNLVIESFPERCRTKDGVLFVNWQRAGQFCIQVITRARNPQTGEVRDFPTPCDAPEGWKIIK